MRERVWAIAMVRDEADIIEYAVRHLASQDIDGILIADNNSRDDTKEIIVETKVGCRVVVVDDDEVGFHQSRAMTSLARRAAAEHKANWIIPFDADELWHASGKTVGSSLRALSSATTVVHSHRWNHMCSAEDIYDANPFVRMIHRSVMPMKRGKVAFRYDPSFVLKNGQHSIRARGVGVRAKNVGGFKIRHFPYRSLEHFILKSKNGLESLRVANSPAGLAGQWRRYGELYEAGGVDAMRIAFDEINRIDTVVDPAPYCGVGR